MRIFLFLVLLASCSISAGGRGEGTTSSLAATVRYAVERDLDTLKFNNGRMIVIVKKINLDSAAVEAFANGLDKDSIKNDGDTLNPLQVKGYRPKAVSEPVNSGNDTSATSIESLRVKGYQEW